MGAWMVLRDPSFAYRRVALGALVPDVFDAPFGHRAIAHTLVFAVGALAVVMLATTNRRPIRRHVIAIPIGLFAHLVLDGVWANKTLFWWPAFGDWGHSSLVPPVGLVLVREVIGLIVLVSVLRRFGLSDPERRRAFLQTGKLTPC
jgi:membrane-bound metal-dependent hydrolase YbcI (DUF457 family)